MPDDICFISNCGEPGVIEIKDATRDPKNYNGKKLCKEHNIDREYMKENDIRET